MRTLPVVILARSLVLAGGASGSLVPTTAEASVALTASEGSVRIEESEPIPMVSEGRCGICPHATDVHATATAVRVAFVDGRARVGLWATLTVR
jgi:hypothetical protein